MRGAGRLYAVHIALAALGVGLLGASSALIFVRQSFTVPSSHEISEACDRWLATGGPVSLLGLAVTLLAMTTLGLAIASTWRQVRASRRYLGKLPLRPEPTTVEGVRCHTIAAPDPQAFCAGFLRPRIYLSDGAREQLGADELRAVLVHEDHHRSRRDPLRLLAARIAADALFFVPILRRIAERYAALGELAADAAAVKALRGRGPLASALLKFSEPGLHPATVVSIAPERVDHLLGDPAVGRWTLPPSPLGRSALALAALAVVSVSLWAGVVHPDLQAPLLFVAACAGMMICGPIVLAIVALLVSGRALVLRRG
jgi:Zn-dependent protease with chaperone function